MDGLRTATVGVALALLLALSPVAALPLDGGATASTPAPSTPENGTASAPAVGDALTTPVAEEPNTTSYLALPASEVETTRFGTATVDAAGTVALDRSDLDGRYEYLWLTESFGAAETDAERRAVLEQSASRIDDRIADLERRERRALAAFNDGEISTRAYLRELAAIDQGTDALSRPLTQLYEYADSMRDPPVTPSRIAELKTRLVGLRGPVRDRVSRTMRGEAEPVRVHVETTDSAVVLAMITGTEFNRQYVREAYVPGARNPNGPDQFYRDGRYYLEAARLRASELYPWTFDNSGPTSTGLRTGEPYLYRAGVYSVTVDHPHGTANQGDLVTYIDGVSGDVFRELQYKDVSEVPTAAPRTNTSNGLRVLVNRTRAGGPMSVHVVDNATGEPVAAEVFVSGDPVGTTGADGRLWTIAPRQAFPVAVSTGDRNATVGPMFPTARP